mmetsp:Transcript_9269/g.13714  ORF Transcript_9269/g.13714 Transcript_9269/m.13714 type:complete len:104 (+) Transcript_9269:745-1056(+)
MPLAFGMENYFVVQCRKANDRVYEVKLCEHAAFANSRCERNLRCPSKEIFNEIFAVRRLLLKILCRKTQNQSLHNYKYMNLTESTWEYLKQRFMGVEDDEMNA